MGSVPMKAKASGHPEVNEEVTAARELDDNIFPATAHTHHPIACERSGDGFGSHRRRQTRVEDGDVLEPPPFQRGRKREADRLDLRELGHAAERSVGLAPDRPG